MSQEAKEAVKQALDMLEVIWKGVINHLIFSLIRDWVEHGDPRCMRGQLRGRLSPYRGDEGMKKYENIYRPEPSVAIPSIFKNLLIINYIHTMINHNMKRIISSLGRYLDMIKREEQ